MKSLLGKFYYKIKGAPEDIASESLTYILNKSVKAKDSIKKLIKHETGLNISELNYLNQKSGDDLERPDICGIDENGGERLLIESKFWASLTDNQPNSYINRIDENSVLLFLVPSLRVRTLYEEILRKIKNKYNEIIEDSENRTIKIINRYCLVVNWDDVLNMIKQDLEKENNQNLISDVNQLIGFCHTIDRKSFQPINDIDLSPRIPKQIKSYVDIVDKVVDEIKNMTPKASTSGLHKTPQRYGYHRYFTLKRFGFAMALRMDHWSEHADTPFWLSIAIKTDSNNWKRPEILRRNCKNLALEINRKFVYNNPEMLIALIPKTNETEDVVINDLADQIQLIVEKLDNETE